MAPFMHRLAALLLGLTLLHTVNGKFILCQLQWEMRQAQTECQKLLQLLTPTEPPAGCHGEWDNVLCWRSAAVGEVLTLPCPTSLLLLFGKHGKLSRNCTKRGWSVVYPDITVVCSSDSMDQSSELLFYRLVHVLSTLGHSLSLAALLTSSIILCVFRKLRCTRNYIHLNLFASFMLRAAAVLAKDALLFPDHETADCSTQPSLVGCKATLVFCHYFIMANFLWLLVEGVYLHALLLLRRSGSAHLPLYMLVGWGVPFVFVVAWVACRVNMEDTWCWEVNDNPVPDRLINWPIMTSIMISFILFISIIRILVQKLRSTDVGGNDQSQYRRLAKSTLVLIPLFGVNYVVFFYLMESADRNMKKIKIFFELALGSFQGLIVAVLYCFLNSEVQGELRRRRRSLSLRRSEGRDYRPHAMSVSRSGVDNSQLPRNSRAPSILQTETTVL